VNVDVEVGGRRRRLEAARTGRGWRVSIDGKPFDVDAVRVGDRWSLLIDRTSHDVGIDDREGGELIVHVDGTAVPVTVVDPRGSWARRDDDKSNGDGPRHIVAPMPGRVVKILVAAGDEVVARQGVVVVEAMKMENELRAPRDGRVAEVRVVEGALVDANAVLVVIA
jgi:biotin carboxyl carrier protein